jgi:hypothetical protein
MLASLFVGHAAQKSTKIAIQYDEGGNHMAETETETETLIDFTLISFQIDDNK